VRLVGFITKKYTDGAHTRTVYPNIKEVGRLNCSSQLHFLISVIAFNKYINSKHLLFLRKIYGLYENNKTTFEILLILITVQEMQDKKIQFLSPYRAVISLSCS
jgi:hypothetical protein